MSRVHASLRWCAALVLVGTAVGGLPGPAGAAPANPLTVRLSAGLRAQTPDLKQVTVTALHPGTQAMVRAVVTNTGAVPLDRADVRFRFPADGTLRFTSLVGDPAAATCTTRSATSTVCTVTGLAPGEKRTVAGYARVSGPTSGTSCARAAVSPDRTTVPEVVSTTSCISRTGWPRTDTGTGFAVGDRVHDLTLVDERGKVARLSDYRGSYLQLDFSGAWCPASMEQAVQDSAEIAALGDALGAPVRLLTVLVDGSMSQRQSTATTAQAWRTKFKLPTHVLATQADKRLEALQQQLAYTPGSETVGFPTNVFVTPRGRIFHIRMGRGEPGDTTAIFRSRLPGRA